MDEVTKIEETDHDVRKEVVLAYHEVINQLKAMNQSVPEEVGKEENEIQNRAIVESASRETVDELAKHIAEFKTNVIKTCDDIKAKLSFEYEKFYRIRQAISISEEELEYHYDIKTNINTLSALTIAQREKQHAFEKEIKERKINFENEMHHLERERVREQNDYIQKRDGARKREQEQYENEKRKIYQELLENRHNLEVEFETREATLAAREAEHQQLKDREARILAREQEFAELKEKEIRFPEELRHTVQKAENLLKNQLMRKHEYDTKLARIEWDSERAQLLQKIETLEKQIEQYKTLKQVFSVAVS